MGRLAFIFLFPTFLFTQVFRQNIPVLIGGDTLSNAWMGGFNAPQFAMTDLNGDGLKDLVIYDRSDEQLLCFLRVGNQVPAKFQFAPEYIGYFPLDHLQAWIRLVDYNCDGWEDLFTSVNSYVRVFRRIPGSPPQFVLAYDTLVTEYFSGSKGYLYSASVDMPGVADIDFDGDIDFLTWDILGGLKVEWDKNLAMELYGRCDTFVLKKTSTCFGHFYENFDPNKNTYDAVLNYYCGPGQRERLGIQHIGGSLEPLNLNGDTLMDLIISDYGPWDLIALTNGGTREIAHFVDKDTVFPRNTTEASIFLFPAAYFVDGNGDGINDLLVAPNIGYDYALEGPANKSNVLFYLNQGNNDSLELIYQGTFSLLNEIIDLGRLSAPALFDYDQDGDYDLIIGIDARAYPDGTVLPGLALLRNIGTTAQPVFRIESEDLLQFSSFPSTQGIRRVVPTFGDLDGDGDPDLLLGEKNGNLWFYRNISSGSTTIFQYVTNLFDTIDVGMHAAPTLYDLDRDGDLDLFIGNRLGHIQAYENIGGPNNPHFQLVSTKWGDIQITDPYLTNLGNTQPFFFDYDQDNNIDLLVASVNPYIVVYQNPTLYTSTPFVPVDTIQIPYHRGEFKFTIYPTGITSPYSFIIGTVRGGLLWYEPPSSPVSILQLLSGSIQPKLYPNPVTNDLLHVEVPNTNTSITAVEIFSIQGEKVHSIRLKSPQLKVSLNVSHLPKGFYLVKVHTSSRSFIGKMLRLETN